MTLADAIELYGTPAAAEICSTDGDVLVVLFKDNISIISNMDNMPTSNEGDWLTPDFLFDTVAYDTGTGTSWAFTRQIPWRGFTVLSDYVCSEDK